MKEIQLHLLIDDIRDLNTDLIARTYEVGISCLLMLQVTHLYLDHDLGGPDGKTGYDILKFIFDPAVKEFKVDVPRFIQLVTQNPVGRINMEKLLKSEGYETINGINFINKR